MIFKDFAPRKYTGPTQFTRQGLLVVYTGEGKGKTTAAFGAVFRSLGRGMRVAVVQFIKGKWVSGEVKALKKFGRQAVFFSCGEDFTWNTKDLKKDRLRAKRGWDRCVRLLKANRHQLYVFDELLYVLKYRFLSVSDVLEGLKKRHPEAHVILTGRGRVPQLHKIADLVTDFRELKHPFKRGVLAQPGIDF